MVIGVVGTYMTRLRPSAAGNLWAGLSMPGNEVGDRVHNFFGQENLSQGQHHSQPIDGNWPGLSNNLWVGGQRPIGGPFISSLKNYNVQQSDPERGHGSQSSHMPHGVNFSQSNLKPEFGRVQSPNQQPALNGYMHGNQVFQARQNEANFLGVDTDTNRHNLVPKSLSMSQQGNASEHNKKNSMRLDASESPVSFDFFGGQHQMSSQHLNVLQSLPRQQPGNSDMQLLQRHMMLQQLQEFQRHQQIQQLEPRQQAFTNHVSSVVKQAAGSHSPSLINGVPINEASNNLWQPELVAGSTNWMQRGAPPVMPGSSSGHMFSPEQGQALRLMDMVPQQADQSLYGVPISSTSGTPGSYSHTEMDKATMQQISASNNSVSGNPYTPFPDQVSMQEGTRQDFQGKNIFGSATGQGLSGGFNLENLQQVNQQQRSPPVQEFQGRQEVAESSEPSLEKSFNNVTSSQNAATLDPTEEKILFGSDDNVWDAFGRSTNMGMGGCMLDGVDYSSGYPPLQSGSWSALMQSAVAETSSGDTGIQEDWCGPSVHNSEAPTGNQQLSSVNHGGKLQGVWGDNNFQPAIAPSSRPSSLSVDASKPNLSNNSFGLPQFQQSEYKTQQVQGDMLHIDSSQRFIPKFSEQGGKWSDRGHPQKQSVEGSQIYGSVSHPSGAETNANSNSGSWARQQSASSHNSDTHLYNRPNGWNFIDSVPADGGDNFRTPEIKSSFQPAQSGDGKRGMHDELGHVAGMWKTDSSPTSNTELEPAKPSIGSPRVGRNASSLNNIAVANSSTMRPNQEGKQQLPISQKLDFWKVVDSSESSKGAEGLGKNQHNLGKSPQILESSGTHSLERGMVEMHEADNSNNKDNSADGFHALHRTSTAGLKDNVWSDAGGLRALPGGKQKSSGNVSRRPPGTRKFQYHPMGDVEVDNEPSYGAKQVTHSQTLPQQGSRVLKGYDQGSFGQPKFGGHMDNSSLDMEKGHSPGGLADAKGLDATPLKNMFPGFAPNTSTSFGRGISNYAPNKVPPSSQHMLELLHKVDHPREHSNPTHLSSSDRNMSSEMPEAETSEGSVGHVQRNQSSSSQNFGLQLAPPSQRLSSTDHAVSSQNSSKVVFGSTHVTHEAAEKGPVHLASRASAVPFPSSYEPSQGHGNNKASNSNVQGSYSTAFPSGFPYARNLENQHMHASSGQIMPNQSVHMPFNRISSGAKQLNDPSDRAQASQFVTSSIPELSASTPQNNLASLAETSQLSSVDQTQKKDLVHQILESDRGPATQPSVQQSAFSKMLPNAWPGVSREQPPIGSQSLKAASRLFKPQLQSNESLVTAFPGPSRINEQDSVEGRNELCSTGVISANSQNFVAKEQPDKESCGQQVLPDKVETAQKTFSESQGNESVVNNFSEASLANYAATQRDIEAFGRSLRPNNSLHDNYSLLHQVQAMKSTEIDSTDRSTKRLKGSDHLMDPQQVGPGGGQQSSYGFNSAARDSLANQTSVPSGDPKMLSFSSKLGDTRDSNASSQDMFAFGQNSSNNLPSNSTAPSINPRMAPSWFDQYGTFKNGQRLQVYDMQRASAVKSMEQPFMVGKLADDQHAQDSMQQGNIAADGGKFGIIHQVSAPTSAVSEHFTSPHLIPHASDQSLVVGRPKKRKSATSELVPWHKELINVSERLRTISMAEAEWAKATNRLAEKVEEEAEMVEDALPVIKPRRRLILTTQLMQQLLRPPPAAVLSSDASLQYESAAYFSARLALGDACSATGCSESEAPLPSDDRNLLSEKLKTPKRIDQYFSKVVEDFIGRARKLESDLLRLDKRASILELRVESQDLEKFSVINRFAKFHGRGQTDGTETSSASDGTLNGQKSCPQKYVTGLPMPRNLPDRVQCLSL